eukprot:GILK01000374.1.p1 GENE.GILK01000374.1~~GILK01000374.1.p1  ORF type:complete len:295 (-),score=33.87 GILK01000374.1:88-972(-)
MTYERHSGKSGRGLLLSATLLLAFAVSTNGLPGRQATCNGDMRIANRLRVGSLVIPSGNAAIDGRLLVVGGIHAAMVDANSTSALVLSTGGIQSPTGSVMLQGFLQVTGDIRYGDSSFIQTDELLLNGVKQWNLVSHEDFEQGAEGWRMKMHGQTGSSGAPTGSCVPGGNKHMGGHCQSAGHEFTRTYTNLPPHSHLKISAKYHFIDSWEGEAAYAKIDNAYVWIEHHHHAPTGKQQGIHMCGDGQYKETRWGVPIDTVVSHTGSSVTVAFGALLDEHPCNESFGVDDVTIYVK